MVVPLLPAMFVAGPQIGNQFELLNPWVLS